MELSVTSFVVSKTRVSSLKPFTIPRLELISALCLARLLSNVTNGLMERFELQEPKCFTDTQITLFGIKDMIKDWKFQYL